MRRWGVNHLQRGNVFPEVDMRFVLLIAELLTGVPLAAVLHHGFLGRITIVDQCSLKTVAAAFPPTG